MRDVYFDDRTWQLEQLVVALDPQWHGHKQVLISPMALDGFRDAEEVALLKLRSEDLAHARPAAAVLPVCKQYASLAMSSPGASHLGRNLVTADPHLRSARAVTNYRLQLNGEFAGMLADLLFDPEAREIRYLAVEQVIERRKVRFHILPSAVERFSWATQRVHLKHLQPVLLEDSSSVFPAGSDFLVA